MIRIFFTGLFISFLGTLPLGVLNVAAAQLAVNAGIEAAVCFSLGATLVEMGYVRLSLVAMGWVQRRSSLFRWLQWLSVAIVLVMAMASFVTAGHGAGHGAVLDGVGFSGLHSGPVFHSGLVLYFISGMLLSAVNPLQIPFWFGWSTVLITKGVLLARADHYNRYIAGIGLGTLAGNGVFIFGGSVLIKGLAANGAAFNMMVGGVLLITAFIQAGKMLSRRRISTRSSS